VNVWLITVGFRPKLHSLTHEEAIPMSFERTEESSQSPMSTVRQTSEARRVSETARNGGASGDATHPTATVLVRGETIRDQEPKSPAKDKTTRKEVSDVKVQMQGRLPVLDDDTDVGVQKEQIVIRDGKADLAFPGKLLASAAPASASKGQWQEYRVYETDGGKHVFSKIARSVYTEDQDTHEAEIFDPSPSSVPSQLLRSARELARSRPLTWMDAAAAFFGYDPLAKTLYRKLSGQFEEHIS
jgi:hypothetical protein